MANTTIDQGQEAQAARLRAWILGLFLTVVVVVIGGLVLAAFVDGPAQLGTGLTFVVAMGLALVVGLSKTSSA